MYVGGDTKWVAVIETLFCGARFETGRDKGIWGKDGGSRRGDREFRFWNIRRSYLDRSDGLGVGESALSFLGDTTRARLLQITFAFG